MAHSGYWLTVIDASEALDLPLRTVYDMIERGQLRARRVGRATMIARPDLESVSTRPATPAT